MYENSYLINQASTQVGSLHGLRGELRRWRDETDPAGVELSRKTIRGDRGFHAEAKFAQVGLRHVGPDPEWVGQGKGQDRILGCHHAAGFQDPVADDTVRREHRVGRREVPAGAGTGWPERRRAPARPAAMSSTREPAKARSKRLLGCIEGSLRRLGRGFGIIGLLFGYGMFMEEVPYA